MTVNIDPEETIVIRACEEEIHYKLDMDVGDQMYADIVEYAENHLNPEERKHLLFEAGFKRLLENCVKEELRCKNGQLNFDFTSA